VCIYKCLVIHCLRQLEIFLITKVLLMLKFQPVSNSPFMGMEL